MTERGTARLAAIPSVERVLQTPEVTALGEAYGRTLVTEVVREVTAALRRALADGARAPDADRLQAHVVEGVIEKLAEMHRPSLRPVINLTGTVLHTNLGRAPLPPEAIEAMGAVAGAANVELDLTTGRRGDRDAHAQSWLTRLTGAQAATVVNNNAAAVLLTLNSLAMRRQVPVSRGELIEIGGAFRMPDIMARAGCKLVEVGTTNRTHPKDFHDAINARTALLMKVHTSNYEVRGFTASVEGTELAQIAHRHALPLVNDLGSGTLTDLTRFGLPHEPSARETIAEGADVVTFSGDKLLGGPQCGIIIGRADLIARIKRNPMKRAMRVDKLILAALGAILPMYANPSRLVQRIPTLRLLAREAPDIEAQARRLAPRLTAALGDLASVEVRACLSQVGSGALPVEALASCALALRPARRKSAPRSLNKLAAAFRALPVPVLGRVSDDALLFDLRCLEDEDAFVRQLSALELPR